MKVLVVGTGGALGGSGITTVADQMVRTLERMGHEPTRLVAGDRRRKRPNRLNLENVAAVIGEARAVRAAARTLGSDVVWLHSFGVPALPALRTLVQVIAVRSARRPVLVHFHAFALAEQITSGGTALRILLRACGRLSHRLVALHADDGRALQRFGATVVIENWIEVPDSPPALPTGPPSTLVFIGGLVTRKGLPSLLDAVRRLSDRDIALTVVGGPGDEGVEVAAEIEESAIDLVASGQVRFTGQLDRAGVTAALAAAQVFVLPSAAEGTPIALLEALAAGRAVVVSDVGSMGDIVSTTGCGTVLRETDPVAIAAAISPLVADRARLEAAGRAAYDVALSRFSETVAITGLTKVLAEVARRGG